MLPTEYATSRPSEDLYVKSTSVLQFKPHGRHARIVRRHNVSNVVIIVVRDCVAPIVRRLLLQAGCGNIHAQTWQIGESVHNIACKTPWWGDAGDHVCEDVGTFLGSVGI